MKASGHGFGPSAVWALSASAHQRQWGVLARALKMLNYVLFKAILPPEASMVEVPRLMHLGLGVVIHPSTQFGSGVLLAHQVTVAASPEDDSGQIFPVIFEDKVFVGAGAILIARHGPLRIGAGAVVGAGSVVLDDVEPGGRVFGIPAKPVRPT